MDSWDTSLVSDPDVPDDPGVETFLWYIFRKNKFTDVEFELETPEEPVTFSAHKMVLAMWSPIFEDMFYRGDEKNLVCLKGVNPRAFKDLLRFMYGCEPVLDSYENACDLYQVAIKFGVCSVTSLCQQFLLSVNIESSNVFHILEAAKCMQNDNLIEHCMSLIQTQTNNVLNCYKLSDFTPSMIEVILKSPKLSIKSEFELILWLFAWAKNRYLEHHIYSNLREVLEDFLPYFDFLALSNAEFACICKQYDNFFSEDEALKIFMNIGIRNSRPMPDWYEANVKRRMYCG